MSSYKSLKHSSFLAHPVKFNDSGVVQGVDLLFRLRLAR